MPARGPPAAGGSPRLHSAVRPTPQEATSSPAGVASHATIICREPWDFPAPAGALNVHTPRPVAAHHRRWDPSDAEVTTNSPSGVKEASVSDTSTAWSVNGATNAPEAAWNTGDGSRFACVHVRRHAAGTTAARSAAAAELSGSPPSERASMLAQMQCGGGDFGASPPDQVAASSEAVCEGATAWRTMRKSHSCAEGELAVSSSARLPGAKAALADGDGSRRHATGRCWAQSRASHAVTSPSDWQATRSTPSSSKAQWSTGAACANVARHRSSLRSESTRQRRSVPSTPALATRRPSEESERELTAPACTAKEQSLRS